MLLPENLTFLVFGRFMSYLCSTECEAVPVDGFFRVFSAFKSPYCRKKSKYCRLKCKYCCNFYPYSRFSEDRFCRREKLKMLMSELTV